LPLLLMKTLHDKAYLPKDLVEQFQTYLDQNLRGSPDHIEKLKAMWNTAKKVIITLQLSPQDYFQNKNRFYTYFQNKHWSPDYSKKLLRLINLYGEFVSDLQGRFFKRIPNPKGYNKEALMDSYTEAESYKGPSEPLTPEILRDLKEQISEAQYNWLFVTVWLGLRPSEVDLICKDSRKWRLEESDEVDVLWVYQPKLKSKERKLRWKPIPLLYDEQREAVNLFQHKVLARPLVKTVKKHTGQHITLYGGRKGFTDLMLARGQSIEAVSQWLGHTSLEMTWKHYKDRRRVIYSHVGSDRSKQQVKNPN
jgi:integrase